MYNMTKKYFYQLLDGLHLALVVDVREGVFEKVFVKCNFHQFLPIFTIFQGAKFKIYST